MGLQDAAEQGISLQFKLYQSFWQENYSNLVQSRGLFPITAAASLLKASDNTAEILCGQSLGNKILVSTAHNITTHSYTLT